MKFILVDRITELESGRRIVAHKALSLAEEYLADHFPSFPVLPGVFMLEAMVQTCAWLVREKLDFAPSIIVLKEAKNVTYKSFLPPGQVLRLEGECLSLDGEQSTFSARGLLEGREIVKARLTLRHLTLGSSDAGWAETDEKLRAHWRRLWNLVYKGGPTLPVATAPVQS